MKRGLALALFALVTSVVATAQFHGVPPSVTSLGPGRSSTPGVPASITSMGPVGYGFITNRQNTDLFFGRHPNFITSFRHRKFHRHFFPVVVAPYYWPYYGWDYSLDAPDTNAYQQQPTAPVVMLERRSDDGPAETRSAPPPPAPGAHIDEQEPTILVFRDGHRQEVKNYAIVGQTLWDFSAKGTHKIPLAELDLDTTRKLNDDRGVEFILPKS